jgi:hypothetical protein
VGADKPWTSRPYPYAAFAEFIVIFKSMAISDVGCEEMIKIQGIICTDAFVSKMFFSSWLPDPFVTHVTNCNVTATGRCEHNTVE